MKRSLPTSRRFVVLALFTIVGTGLGAQAQAQEQAPLPVSSRADEMLGRWNGIGNKLIAMAQDFPEVKYDFKLQ